MQNYGIIEGKRKAGALRSTVPDVALVLDMRTSAMSSILIPPGLCQCGCGNQTTIAQKTNSPRKQFRGQPLRYFSNHGGRRNTHLPMPARFWAEVDQSAGAGSCWAWQESLLTSGYGQMRVDGQRWRVHRLAWVLTHGPIPAGLFVCHTCDVRACCNPAHLFLGTTDDNMADMVAKGRQARNDRHGRAKFTVAEIETIRARFQQGGITRAALAREYKVSWPAIAEIVRGTHWKL